MGVKKTLGGLTMIQNMNNVKMIRCYAFYNMARELREKMKTFTKRLKNCVKR